MPDPYLRLNHLGRGKHPSIVALAAYRAGERLADTRLGLHHDDSARADVLHREILLPDGAPAWAADRAALWNAVEAHDTGKRASLAREFVVALPHELDDTARRSIARAFAQELVERYRTAVDLAVHAPREDGDERNHHAHLLLPARTLGRDGLAAQTDLARPWPQLKAEGIPSLPAQVIGLKERYIELANAGLHAAGLTTELSRTRLDEFGIRRPTQPHWSRSVEARLRDGKDSAVVNGELRRYAYELDREALALRAAENELHRERLRATVAGAAHPVPAGGPIAPAAPTPARPTDFASWQAWRAQQTFDPAEVERQARAAWLEARARTLAGAGTEPEWLSTAGHTEPPLT